MVTRSFGRDQSTQIRRSEAGWFFQLAEFEKDAVIDDRRRERSAHETRRPQAGS